MTELEGILYHSKQIIKCKSLLLRLRQTLATACTLRYPLPSHESIKQLVVETHRRIEEHNQPIKLMMNAVLRGKGYDFSNREMSHLSSQEIKDGYVLLKDKNTNSDKEATHILFLKDYKQIRGGDILKYEDCELFLTDIPISSIDNQ